MTRDEYEGVIEELDAVTTEWQLAIKTVRDLCRGLETVPKEQAAELEQVLREHIGDTFLPLGEPLLDAVEEHERHAAFVEAQSDRADHEKR